MSTKLFSDKEDLLLKEVYQRMTNKEIVELFNGSHSRDQIRWRAKSLGLTKTQELIQKAQDARRGKWLPWEDEIIRKHFPRGIQECHKYLEHRGINSMRSRARRIGVKLDYDVFCAARANGPKHHSDVAKEKMSESQKGRKFSEEHKLKISQAMRGNKHPNWKGGRSYDDYGPEFSLPLKRKVKSRDKMRCAICGVTFSWKKLHVHHISYDKTNNNLSNLITLCLWCHSKHHNKSDEEATLEQQFFIESVGVRNAQLVSGNTDLANPSNCWKI